MLDSYVSFFRYCMRQETGSGIEDYIRVTVKTSIIEKIKILELLRDMWRHVEGQYQDC